jgi:hypothetical protein
LLAVGDGGLVTHLPTPLSDGSYVASQNLANRESYPLVMIHKRPRAPVIARVWS